MLVKLAYGRTGLAVEFPDDITTVIEPTFLPGLPDQENAVLNAIRNPVGDVAALRKTVSNNQTVAISVCDVTRPMPSSTVLPVLLGELDHVPRSQIKIIIASGTHRATTQAELDNMLGTGVSRNYEIIVHDAFDSDSLQLVGETPDHIPIWLNLHWVSADFKITTGFVEPHFFAGFSGGPKMVAPGLAGFETTMHLHNAARISHPQSRWGITEGNPIHDAVRHIAGQTGVDFSLDVTINRNHEITSVYAGDLLSVHSAACRTAKSAAMQTVSNPFDVVVTSNSGYPLDQNLYQSIKGISAAAQVVRDGGTIICAAECSDGIPDHGQYKKLLGARESPDALLAMINEPAHNIHDQWQVQIQAQIQQRARVLLKSSYLTHQQVRDAHIEPVDDIASATLAAASKAGSTICVLPEGPQTIPYIGS